MMVKVVGIGGIGCCLVPVLARFLNYHYPESSLVLIDGDDFVQENKNRQSAVPFCNKAEAVQGQLLEQGFDNLTILSRAVYVTEKTVDTQIEDRDVVFLCVDNPGSRRLVSDYAAKELRDIVIFSGSNDLIDGSIQTFVRKGGMNQTLPLANDNHPEIRDADPTVSIHLGCQAMQEAEPQLIITNNLVAAMMLSRFYAYLDGWDMEEITYVDIIRGSARSLRY